MLKRNCCDHCLGSIFLSWHIFSPWQSYLHPFLHEPDDNRHCNCCMKAKKKFTWQWIFPLNVSVQKWLVLACLTEARGDPTRSSSSPSPSRSTAAREPLKYSPMRPSELLGVQVVSAINGDDADNEWQWWQNGQMHTLEPSPNRLVGKRHFSGCCALLIVSRGDWVDDENLEENKSANHQDGDPARDNEESNDESIDNNDVRTKL